MCMYIIGILAIALVASLFLTNSQFSLLQQQVTGQQQEAAIGQKIVQQGTVSSDVDPLKGHEGHQAAVILPPRNDTKIYSGTVTFSSSHPVELIVTHPFNLTQAANASGFIPEPLTIPGQNTTLAILHQIGQGVQFDTISFAGSSLSLHNRAGQNFTVSYSVAGDLLDATGIPK